MWTKLLDRMLSHLMAEGQLEVAFPDGTRRTYGDGSSPSVSVVIHSPQVVRQLVTDPDLGLGEGYMNGDLTIENDDLFGLLTLAIKNKARANGRIKGQSLRIWLRRVMRSLTQYNPIGKAQSNVAHHYDLSGDLYDLFLDEDRQYSCAYFIHPDDTLEQAQAQKKAHIAHKLLIRPGMKVLDIGCGWGGMGLTLAQDYGAQVVGVTLSREQHAVATERARMAGLADQVDFRLMDYREVDETFDRIVSVGMFEHVGVPHYQEYFSQVDRMLRPDGVALIHTIGRVKPPGFTSPFIAKHIFPGGYCPALSETMEAAENTDLVTTDVEVWRLHYAETLKHWRQRFEANIEKARALYDDRFCRLWRYYLIASELTFRLDRQVVFQLQMAHRQDTVPLTRDYLYSEPMSQMKHAAE
ncbi:MAG: cyclopropane-fatty-acyl-phospholipid synthase family protein [Paracoccaceae bacterium]|nr:cyclopropane-fatty-acyl-phospholipid synthase family protein [Paracoccaceae bacterium]